jgi:hypothetical protein
VIDQRKRYIQISAEKYKISLYQGALQKDGNQLEEILFPLWEMAMTDFLAECGLPSAEQLRFKNMPTNEKKSSFKDSQYGFPEFVSNFTKAREKALGDFVATCSAVPH